MYIYFANTLFLILFHYYFLKNKNEIFEKYVWIFSIFFLSIFIGFRFEIGGDWQIYNNFFFHIGKGDVDLNFKELLDYGLLYVSINKIAYFLGIQFIGVNFIFALIFMHSLSNFIKDTDNRWLTLAISFPIIIVILGMGYTRQGLAFAFSLYLIRSLENKNFLLSVICLILAVLSHISAVMLSLFMILYAFYYKKYFQLIVLILIPTCFIFLFFDKFTHLLYYYVGSGQHMLAFGSIPRALLLLLVAFLFLYLKNKYLDMTSYQIFFYKWISYIVIIIFPFSVISSVTADRLLFYLYSLKLALVSFAKLKDVKINTIIFILVSIYFFYLIVWMYYGVNSFSWLPYNLLDFNEKIELGRNDYVEVEAVEKLIKNNKIDK